MAMGRPFDLPYSVELWDDADLHAEELIALTGDYRVARAAFEEAVKRRPGRIVTLRQKTRLLADGGRGLAMRFCKRNCKRTTQHRVTRDIIGRDHR